MRKELKYVVGFFKKIISYVCKLGLNICKYDLILLG